MKKENFWNLTLRNASKFAVTGIVKVEIDAITCHNGHARDTIVTVSTVVYIKGGGIVCVYYSMRLNSLRRSDAYMRQDLTIIGSDNGLSPGRRQAIIWTNAGIMFLGSLGTNLIEIHTFLFKKMHLKMSSGKRRPSCFGPNVLVKPPLKLWHGWIITSHSLM